MAVVEKLPYQRVCLFLLTLCLLGTWVVVPSSAQSAPCRSVKTESMKIALTFDDGPHPHLTGQILDILEQYGVRATFFMIGQNVENYPDAAREVIRRGHEVGNHTFSHTALAKLSESDVREELERCEDALDRHCDYSPRLFRPPQGLLSEAIDSCARQGAYRLILWSLDTRDWEIKAPDHIVSSVLSRVQSGDIILMHDYVGVNSGTPQALAILLPALLERGFEPVTVSELLEEE